MVFVSLWYWWKEVMFISFVTAFSMNVLITRPLLQQIRLNFRRRLDQVGSAELFSPDGNVSNEWQDYSQMQLMLRGNSDETSGFGV